MNSNNEPAHFYPNACAICLHIGNKSGSVLRVCEKCCMVSYCTEEHQKQHWPRHEELCKAIERTHRSKNREQRDPHVGLSTEGWLLKQGRFMLTLMQKLGRQLTTYEQEMCIYAIKCQFTCSSDYNFVNCQNCASVSFCTRHDHGMAEHYYACARLKQCFTADVFDNKRIEIDYMMDIYNRHSFEDMLSFSNRFIRCTLKEVCPLTLADTIALHSEYFTRPLTVLHALELIAKKRAGIGPRDEYVGKTLKRPTIIRQMPICGLREENDEMVECNMYKRIPEDKDAAQSLQLIFSGNFIIHVIGADSAEIETRQTWELLFHLLPILEKLTVVMIGPELKQETGSSIIRQQMCSNCVNYRLFFECHNIFYEDYVCSPFYKKPHLTVAFNPEFFNYTCGFLQSPHLWKGTIMALSKQDCPLLLTALSEDNEIKEYNCVMRILKVDGLFPQINVNNPYASLQPRRLPNNKNFDYTNKKVLIYTTFEKEKRKQ